MKITPEALKALNGGGIPAGNNVFSQVNSMLGNLREILKLANQLRGEAQSFGPAPDEKPPRIIEGKPLPLKPLREIPSAPAPPHPPAPPAAPPDAKAIAAALLAAGLDLAIEKGLGDKTIQELLDLAGPFTLKQARGLLK